MMNISKNKCVGCGICEKDCPTGSINVDIKKGIAIFYRDKCIDCGICLKRCPQNAIKEIDDELVVAIGTDDEETIKPDDHFGMSKYFQIWKYSKGEIFLKETRENAKYKEDETKAHGDPGKAKATASVLTDVDALVGKIMGPNIVRLKNRFVPVIIREPEIENAIEIIKVNLNEIFEEKEKTDRSGLVLQ
jgi:NAD-dependent dihydropyrimidine dehydrogenase PreA subunit